MAPEISALLEEFLRGLRSCNCEVMAGASQEALERFERSHGVRIPGDMKDFYAAINGMAELEWAFDSDSSSQRIFGLLAEDRP